MKSTTCLRVLVAVLAIVASARAALAEAAATYSHPATSVGARAGADDAPGDEQAIPAGFHEETQPRKALTYAGAFTFGVPYTLSVVIGAALLAARHDVDPSFHSWWLLVPVAGPFAVLPAKKHTADFTFFLTDGIAQAAGIAMIVSSVIWPRRVLVRNGIADVALTPCALVLPGTASDWWVASRLAAETLRLRSLGSHCESFLTDWS